VILNLSTHIRFCYPYYILQLYDIHFVKLLVYTGTLWWLVVRRNSWIIKWRSLGTWKCIRTQTNMNSGAVVYIVKLSKRPIHKQLSSSRAILRWEVGYVGGWFVAGDSDNLLLKGGLVGFVPERQRQQRQPTRGRGLVGRFCPRSTGFKKFKICYFFHFFYECTHMGGVPGRQQQQRQTYQGAGR